ncbi:hypothetical protein Maq22A_2p42070 (plasmid) [Methylobacterium aquaticum]|uniref:Uncharacterized protein n=1 Tax=Methylobacterium aquaticum TaxID=270351 RepID=A0A0C6FBR6_9HYPH|nr:hypothetical protein Maq22A_2p42070 [Methylobacterium aquaticum]
MPGEPQALGHRLQALALAWPEQATQVERRPVPPGLAAHRGEVRRQPHIQVHRVDTILAHGSLLLFQPEEQRAKQPQSAKVVLEHYQDGGFGDLLLGFINSNDKSGKIPNIYKLSKTQKLLNNIKNKHKGNVFSLVAHCYT